MSTVKSKITLARSWLSAQHILVDEEWLSGCVEYLCDDGHTEQKDINRLAREQWLLNDLKDVCPGSLPPALCDVGKITLTGRYVLQANCAIDVGSPVYQQYQKLKKVNMDNINETTRHDEKIPCHRMIKLHLTDGVQDVVAIEYRTMRNLTSDITPGCKLLIKGPVDSRRGVLLLQEHNVEVVGGEVEDLVTSNSLPALLSRLLGVEDTATGDIGRHDNREFEMAATATLHSATCQAAPNTAHQDTISRRNIVQPPPHTSTTVYRTMSNERSAFDKNKETTASKPVAVVTGIPIIDTSDDDIDLDQIAAIEEQATKQNNKRPLWCDRTSIEKKQKVKHDSRLNEFPDEEDLFDDFDNFQDVFDIKPEIVTVPSEPFVYIKQIKQLDSASLEGKVFKIKAQILKLLSKLSLGKEGWSLRCTLIDGTDTLDADFSSHVLTKLVQYSPSEMNRMKKEMAADPQIKETAIAALNAAKTNLQMLNCIIEISYAAGPRITQLITLTERHARLLEDRVMMATVKIQ